MSENFEKIRTYYVNGFYTKAMLKKLVVVKQITPEEYKEITNEDYSS